MKKMYTLLATSAMLGTASGAVFTWTGGAGTTPWHASGNWSGGNAPNEGDSGPTTRLGTEGESDLVIFNSETAVAGYMPTDTLTVASDWFGSGASDHLMPAVQVLNGTLSLAGPGGAWWHYGGGNIFQIGDSNMSTLAQVNTSFTNWTRHFDRGGRNLITVNADGTLNQTANFQFSTGGGNDTQLTLNGGSFVSSGTVSGLVTGDLDDFVSFEIAGSSFTAPIGGDFATLTDVTDAFGTHFINNSGESMVAVLNGSTFTVSIPQAVIPEPSSWFLSLLTATCFTLRRRR